MSFGRFYELFQNAKGEYSSKRFISLGAFALFTIVTATHIVGWAIGKPFNPDETILTTLAGIIVGGAATVASEKFGNSKE